VGVFEVPGENRDKAGCCGGTCTAHISRYQFTLEVRCMETLRQADWEVKLTVLLECFIARIAAMKNVLSPISDTCQNRTFSC